MFKISHKKRLIAFLVLVVITASSWFAGRAIQRRNASFSAAELQSEPVTRGDLNVTVETDGIVQANQSAQIFWLTFGTVAQVNVNPGDMVVAGEVLANLDKTSLTQDVILARTDLITAQRDLDNLLTSQTQRAEAQKAVEEARRTLEDALNDEADLAHALEAVAQAQKGVEEAELNLAIVVNRPSQQDVDQAYANLVLAENVLNRTREQHEKIQRQIDKPASNYLFFESKALYRGILKSLDLKLAGDQRSYERALEKYNRLLDPVDPFDRMVAEGNLALAHAKLEQAERELERVMDGPSPGEIAVLEAQVVDAQREWERWKEGIDPAEIAAAKARLAAAQAVLARDHLTAPFSGVVTEVAINPGDRVIAGSPAFRLDNLSPLLARLQVSEIAINRVKEGQTVVLKLDSAPGSEYLGRVIEVPLVGREVGGSVQFEVEAEILDPDEKVRPGMTTSADIVVSNLEDVVLVPNRSIQFLNGNRVVYVVRSDQITPIAIELGAASASYSQLLGGELQSGDLVVINLPEDYDLRAASP